MKKFLAASAFLLIASVPTFGQESRATILGTVTDQTGAVVPGVEITVANVKTNVRTSVLTNDSGYYEAAFLIPGSYMVQAELPGFKKYFRKGIELATGQRLTLNIELQVGEATQMVTVTGEVPLLETSNASAGQLIDNRRINELPVTDMNPFALAYLAPGVVRNAEPMFNRAFDNSRTSNISIAGAGNRANEWTLDGMPNATAGNRVAYVPPTDAVQEFRVDTAPFDASVGNSMGGSVNVSVKSGTNEFHGSLYDLHRQQRWNATDWFVNRSFWGDVNAGKQSPKEERQRSGRYNQLGGTAGGPVVLPRIYNGRDRTFFFFSYNGLYDANQEPSFYRTPTQLERNGNFVEILARGGPDFGIYNPFSARKEGNRVVRDPFPNNIIPGNLINPVARKYLEFFPLPNNMDNAGRDLSNNYFAAQQPRNENFYSLLNRFDHEINNHHRMFVRWQYNNRLQDRGDWTGRGFQSNGLRRVNAGLAFDDVYTINNRTVANANLAWSMFREGSELNTDGFDNAQLGFPAYLKEHAGDLQHMSRMAIATLPNIGNPRSDSDKRHIYSARFSLSHARGDHTLRTGLDLRRYQHNSRAPGFVAGSFSFDNTFTRRDSVTSAQQSGLSLAAFLLGLPSGGLVDVNDSYAQQNIVWGAYFQDDWRLNRRLTLNLGLRYEFEGPISERFNRLTVGYDFDSPAPIAAAAEAAYALKPLTELPASQFKVTGGPMFAGVRGAPKTMWRGDKDNIMPRLGAAYRLTDRMVIRGGYGIFYNTSTGVQAIDGFQFGFSQSTPLIASLDDGLTFIGTMADPFPPIQAGGLRFLAPAGPSKGLAQQLGLEYRFVNLDRRNPSQRRWRVGMQYQFTETLIVEVAYTGSTTRDLLVNRRLDALPARFWATGNVRNNAIESDLRTRVANPFLGLIPGTAFNGATIEKQALLRPFPQFSNLVVEGEPQGKSFFHSLEARMEKRFSQGWTLLAAFTKMKQIDQTTRFNEFDTQLDRALSDFNREHHLALSGIWELPYGRGRRFGADAPAWVNGFLGGWQVGAVYQAQSGQPIRFPNVFYRGNTADIFIPSGQRTVDSWFNTSGFVTAAVDQPGQFHVRVFPTIPNTKLRQQGLNLWDMNLLKRFYFDEKRSFQLRLDLLNALNHPHFDQPTTNPRSGNFGKVSQMWGLPRMIQVGLRFVF